MTHDLRIRQAGSSAVLIDCGDLERALGVFAALRIAAELGELTVDELVPAAETVLVRGGEAKRGLSIGPRLRQLADLHATVRADGSATPERTVAVSYTGEDLAEVASIAGMSIDEVITRHTAATYTVAFTGFAPGFAYLAGGDPALNVPRRATPRPRILAGSVGLAGAFSGVYPRESPGGWQLIGTTAERMWDSDRERPAALLAGERVRFVAEREQIRARAAAAPQERTTAAAGTPTLTIVSPGLQTLIEDAGRRGVAGMGVGESGTAIPLAYHQANRLVGNRTAAAALELGHGDFAAVAVTDAVLALTGAQRHGRITGQHGSRPAPHGTPFRLSEGEQLTLGAPERGLRTMLALRGGIAAPPFLGSRSRDTLAQLGPAPLAAGDTVANANETTRAVGAPEPAALAVQALPRAGETTHLRVLLGPRDNWFTDAVEQLTAGQWEVSPRSDRVGVRLAGQPLARDAAWVGRELPSEGVAIGSLQIPPDGQPVLFLTDRPLTGGYPVIAVVHDDDLELAAQLTPGTLVKLVPVTPPAATTPDQAEAPPHTQEKSK